MILLVLGGCNGTDRAQAHLDTGAAHVLKGELDAAIAEYEAGLELEPHSAVGLNLLGMAYRLKYNQLRATRWKEKEIDAFTQAVQADSTYWPAFINLGATLYFLGRRGEAAPYFSTALRLNPDNPEREQLETFIREGGAEVTSDTDD